MPIPLPPDPYKALGVKPTDPEGDIRKVYLKLALKCHPDKIQDPKLKAQKAEEFHKIQQAWELLSDKTKREDYDEKVKINARNASSGDNYSQRSTYQKAPSQQYSSNDTAGYQTREPSSAKYQDFDYEVFEDTYDAYIHTAEPPRGTSASAPPPRPSAFQQDDSHYPPQANIHEAAPWRGTSAPAPPPHPSAFQQDYSRYPSGANIYTAEPRGSEYTPQGQYPNEGVSFEERQRLVAEAQAQARAAAARVPPPPVKVVVIEKVKRSSDQGHSKKSSSKSDSKKSSSTGESKKGSSTGESKKGSSPKNEVTFATSGKHKGCHVRKSHKSKEK